MSVHILIARQHNHSAVEHFNKGIEDYNKGSEANYRNAAEEFRSALALDPKYSQAALFLGRVENALFEDEQALASFKMAIDIDPDYLEARASYAAALLEAGDLDEAVRQLNVVTVARAGERHGLVSAVAGLCPQGRLPGRNHRRRARDPGHAEERRGALLARAMPSSCWAAGPRRRTSTTLT